jgi:hypothetical protein
MVVIGRTPEDNPFNWSLTVLCPPDTDAKIREGLIAPLDPEYRRAEWDRIERQVGFFRHLLADDGRVATELLSGGASGA